MVAPNHYQILQISADATATEVKQAYRRLAKQFHPDSQNNTASHEQIVALNAAYLNNAKMRTPATPLG
ncbi:J domain-containing protein [Spirulina major CS-329]|nr:J domain-containing protein [Spirulina major]MDB9505259.1 J domain-containing protein [Spirulina major CS-329]